MALTKTDLAALRTADRLLFRTKFHLSDSGLYAVPLESFIQCSKQIKNPDPFEDDTRHYLIPVTGSIQCGQGWTSRRRTHRFCATVASSYITGRWNDEWETITSALRAGDILHLSWYAHADSEAMEERGIINDLLSLHATRTSLKGKITRLAWRIDHHVTDLQSNRMIRGTYIPNPDYDEAHAA